MGHPKEGMRYKDALKTAIRHGKEGSVKTVNSMINQVAKHEGQRAAQEFTREVISKANDKIRRGK